MSLLDCEWKTIDAPRTGTVEDEFITSSSLSPTIQREIPCSHDVVHTSSQPLSSESSSNISGNMRDNQAFEHTPLKWRN